MKSKMMGLGIVMILACTPSQQQTAKTAENVVVRIADDLCQAEAQQPNDPQWVAVACKAEGIVFHVILPSTQWQAVHAAHITAPPAPATATSDGGTP
jgi:hypothetical protein